MTVINQPFGYGRQDGYGKELAYGKNPQANPVLTDASTPATPTLTPRVVA